MYFKDAFEKIIRFVLYDDAIYGVFASFLFLCSKIVQVTMRVSLEARVSKGDIDLVKN